MSAALHARIFGPHVIGPDGFAFAPHVGEFFTRMRIDGSMAKADAVRAAADAGEIGGKTFGDRFKASFTKGNVGKGLMQGLGLGAGLGVVSAVSKGVQVLTDAVGGAVDASIGWESAMAGVSKTLDTTGLSAGQATDAIEAIGEGLRSMAKEIPIPVEELASLAEAGGALGIARDDLLSFTRTAALLGTTTDIAAGDAATALGKINAVLPLTRDEYSRFAATLVDLGNKGASTESEIVAMAQRMSGAAALVGMSKADLLGWASALSNVGEEAEAGGSSFQRFALGINQAVSAGTSKLGEIAKVAGTTADEFAALWDRDASEAMRLLVDGLSQMDKGARQAQISALGFKDIRITRALLALTSNVDNLNQSLAVGEDAWSDNSAAVNEAEKRFGTTESKIALLNNQLHDFAIDAGNVLVDLGLALADALDEVRRTIDPTGAAIGDTREQVRRLAREFGLGEDEAVAMFDSMLRSEQQTAAAAARMDALRATLQASLLDMDDAAKNSLVASVLEDIKDLAVEAKMPLDQVADKAILLMQPGGFAVDQNNTIMFLQALRQQLGLTGPAAEQAAAQTADAMDVIYRMFSAQRFEAARGELERFGYGIPGSIARSAAAASVDPAVAAGWTKLGASIGWDLSGGVRKGIEDSQPELQQGILELRAKLRFDWAAEAGYVMGKQWARWVGRGLRSDEPELVDDARKLAVAGLQALDHEGKDGPQAAATIGRTLASLYASGMSRGDVEVLLTSADLSLTALEAIAEKDGWHLAGQGQMQEWRRGHKDERPGTVEAVRVTAERLEAPLAALPGKAYTDGANVSKQLAKGIRDYDDEVFGAATGITKGLHDRIHQDSPAKVGPLSEDGGTYGWGLEAARLYARGLLAGTPAVSGAAGTLAAALGLPADLGLGLAGLGLTTPLSVSAQLSGDLAPITASGTSRHEIVVRDPDGGLARAGVGVDDLARTIAAALLGADRSAGIGYLTPSGI